MVEKNTAARVQAIAFTVVHGEPVSIHLGACIGRSRPKRSGFCLWNRLHLAKHFGRRRLVKPNLASKPRFTDGFKNTLGAKADDVARGLWDIERNSHMALGGQIVNFVGLELVQELHQSHGVRQITIMKEQSLVVHMRILIQVVDATGVESGCAPDDTVDLVALAKQQFGEVRAVLASDSGDECALH